MGIVRRFPTPREQELADELWEMLRGDLDNAAVVFNAIFITLAKLVSRVPREHRGTVGEDLTKVMPRLLGVAGEIAEGTN